MHQLKNNIHLSSITQTPLDNTFWNSSLKTLKLGNASGRTNVKVHVWANGLLSKSVIFWNITFSFSSNKMSDPVQNLSKEAIPSELDSNSRMNFLKCRYVLSSSFVINSGHWIDWMMSFAVIGFLKFSTYNSLKWEAIRTQAYKVDNLNLVTRCSS